MYGATPLNFQADFYFAFFVVYLFGFKRFCQFKFYRYLSCKKSKHNRQKVYGFRMDIRHLAF